MVPTTKITTKAIAKTEVRQTAERSIRSTISFLIAISYTMFQIGPMQTGRPAISKASPGAQILERLVSDANDGLPVHPYHPY